ncbi:MAG: DNA translocase FtsK [Caldiserica bacterium]|jgi:S-DNA-T family DNA segregation ATPase FtsK/SpoIIIE|nr:DNA translocase FtsK [Caldisericota bacterium]MDH7562791.1 DNA translocase FtsK [Caldisericota bacterium]
MKANKGKRNGAKKIKGKGKGIPDRNLLERRLLILFSVLVTLVAIVALYLYLPPVSSFLWDELGWNLLLIVLFFLGLALLVKKGVFILRFFLAFFFLFLLAFSILGFSGEGGRLLFNALKPNTWIFILIVSLSSVIVVLSLTWPFIPLFKKKEEKVVVPLPKARKPEAKRRKEISPVSESTGGAVFALPPFDILKKPPADSGKNPRRETRNVAQILEQLLRSFNVEAKVKNIEVGPAITRYELMLEPGIRVTKVLSLSEDIALALGSPGIRIETPVPNKPLIGIEVPLETISTVYLREIIESEEYQKAKTKLPLALGKDIGGHPVVADLREMPHLLIAGATGSGKSVCVNALLCGILFRSTPDDVRFILIDPKRVELYNYRSLPHLLYPLVVDIKQAALVLRDVVEEMEDRLAKFSEVGARDIEAYNLKVKENGGGPPLPYLVVMIDELADLMMVAPADVEHYICRLAQLARATGIHLVLVTQRPSTDVITGLIKANIPSRISFAVASLMDSRVILDSPGAEKLLGKGDMLFHPVYLNKAVRIQGAFVSEEEIDRLVDFWFKQAPVSQFRPLPQYSDEEEGEEYEGAEDPLFEKAVALVIQTGEGSASMLQRKLKIGYARAGRLIDLMEKMGIVGPPSGSKPRPVLKNPDQQGLKFK